MSNVIHPKHYNIPGRKECIEEMIDVFGWEKVEIFCELNEYKYDYRHELKNGAEDLEKARNYNAIGSRMIERDERFKVADHLGLKNQKMQLIEEMAELTQVINKINRLQGEGLPLAPGVNVEELFDNFTEELADVKLVLDQIIYLTDCNQEVNKIIQAKTKRAMERLGIQDESN